MNKAMYLELDTKSLNLIIMGYNIISKSLGNLGSRLVTNTHVFLYNKSLSELRVPFMTNQFKNATKNCSSKEKHLILASSISSELLSGINYIFHK